MDYFTFIKIKDMLPLQWMFAKWRMWNWLSSLWNVDIDICENIVKFGQNNFNCTLCSLLVIVKSSFLSVSLHFEFCQVAKKKKDQAGTVFGGLLIKTICLAKELSERSLTYFTVSY